MSTKRKPKPTTAAPETITLDRAWLTERLDWLDVDGYAMKMVRELSELTTSHAEAFVEMEREGACSSRARVVFVGMGYESQGEILEQLRLMLENIEGVQKAFRSLLYPKVATS